MWPTLYHDPYLNVFVPTYGLLMLGGVLAGIALASLLARRDGFDPERVSLLWLVTVCIAVLGAHAAWLVNHPGAASLADVLAGRARPGGLLYGGVIAGTVASFLVARALGMRWLRVADAGAPGAALGIAFGKVGCFAAGCCWGRPCDEPWGVVFPVRTLEQMGAPLWTRLHPVQLYEAGLAALAAVVLVSLYRRRSYPGQTVVALFVLLPAARFVTEFWRGDDRGELLGLAHLSGLTPTQLVSLVLLSVALAAGSRMRAKEASNSETAPGRLPWHRGSAHSARRAGSVGD